MLQFLRRNGMLYHSYLTECAGTVLKLCSMAIHQDNDTIIRYHLLRNSMKSVQSSEMLQFGTNRPAATVQSDTKDATVFLLLRIMKQQHMG
jgi:hypothetical protein